MERRFDMSDFEQSLKDHADQFKLMPSKRVWNGIYNNLHPGSSWPSITVAIILVITLITIGNLNNSPKSSKEVTAFNSASKQTNNANSLILPVEKSNVEKNSTEIKGLNQGEKISGFNSLEKNSSQEENRLTNQVSLDKKTSDGNTHQISAASNSVNDNTITSQGNNFNLSKKAGNILKSNENSIPVFETRALQNDQNELAFKFPTILFEKESSIPVFYENEWLPTRSFPTFNLKNAPVIPSTKTGVINSKENTSTNKKLKKKNKNVEWTFYVTPMISSVSFHRKTIHPTPQNASAIVVLPNQPEPSLQLIRNPRLGLETGAEVAFQFSKKFKFITGANINYSSYNNISNLIHPTFATLTLAGKSGNYSKNYLTHYGNGQSPSQINLTNYSLETSIPIGLEYIIWKSGKIEINAASVFEPSAIIKGNAFVISNEGRYYINDPSLIRKFNVSANLGTSITFKGKKIKWHIGPDFRYQLLPTYKNIYPVKEHFLDYGIRIGISK